MRKLLISMEMFLLLILCALPVSAKTETIEKPKTNKINLIEMADKLHENYEIYKDKYVFSFNGNSIGIVKNSPFITINGQMKTMETETINHVVLPKYVISKVSRENVEMNYDTFLYLTKYKTNEKGIEIIVDNSYKKPKEKKVSNLDLKYLNENLTDLGYSHYSNIYEYIINGDVYQTVSISDTAMTINTNTGSDYEDNQDIVDLLVEEILKALDKDNYESIYSNYLTKTDTNVTMGKYQVIIKFNTNNSEIQIEKN